MATQTFAPFKSAPRYAQYASTFRSDERCYETCAVVGDEHDETLDRTVELWNALREGTDKVTDYDVNFDNVSGKWIGVVCIDK